MSRYKNLKSNPFVSIITPSYNSGRYIEECIKSVLNQDYPYIEHIIYDAVSIDKTKIILRKYQKPEYRDRIKIFIEADKGPAYAANKAFLKSKGDIILVLNADDILMPDACSWAIENFQKYPKAAVIYGDEYIIDDKGSIIHKYIPKNYDFAKLLCCELTIPAQAAFIQRKSFERIGFNFDTSLKHAGDYELWVRLGLKFSLKHVNRFITKFRWHSTSNTLSSSLIGDFVNEKKIIMNRIFAKSKKFEKYKKRAYIGLNFWAGIMLINSKAKVSAINYFLKAWFLDPSVNKFKIFFSVWKQAVKDQKALSTLVSIITTSDSSGRSLNECIKSVLSQDYPNVEHIIYYSNSNDNAKRILKRYRKPQYEHRIMMFPEPNKSEIGALCTGIKKANGNIIMLMNAENTIMPKAVTWGINNMKRYPHAGIIICSPDMIYKNGEITDSFGTLSLAPKGRNIRRQFILPDVVFIRRSALEKKGFWKGANWDKFSTHELWSRILQTISTKYIFDTITTR